MSLNLKGTQNIIKLCRGMKHLEVGIPAKRRKLMQRKQQWQKKLKKCNSALCITIKLSELNFFCYYYDDDDRHHLNLVHVM